MILKRLRARLLAAALLCTSATTAQAVDGTPPPLPVAAPAAFDPIVPGCATGGCAGPVGPVVGGCTGLGCAGNGVGLFAMNRRNWRHIDGQNQPACAYNNYPLSDWLYIRRFCQPTLIPGTCYGHFQTKWRKWEDHCPQQADPAAAVAYPTVSYPTAGPSVIYPAPQPSANPSTPLPSPKAEPMPMPMKKDDTDPAKPVKPKTTEMGQLLPTPTPSPSVEIPLPLPTLR